MAPLDGPDGPDEQALAAYAAALADAIHVALPGWVARSVARFVPLTGEAGAAAAAAGVAAQRDTGAAVRVLLATDVDAQMANPLALVRGAVRYPTAVLHAAGVPPVLRDDFAVRAFPSDVYGLSPASFADVAPELAEPGLVWGAAKAHVILRRRRAEGRR